MIHIQEISKQFGSKVLFENAEGHIGNRSRIALIGPNGAGKSTLVRILLGLEVPDSGKVVRAQHLAIGYLAQEVPKFAARTVLEEVLRLEGRRDDLLAARKEMEGQLSQGSQSEELLDRYGRVLEELEGLDEYRLEARAKEILMGMGFKEGDFGRSLSEFSGGWLMRVALSRILLMEPDLLLLDEPTNHLDLESLLWLEGFLTSFRGAMLLISHDRSFLNRIVTEVLEIDQNRLWIYRGNLDAYVQQKEQRLEVLRAQFENQQTKIAEIERFVARFGAKATKAKQAQSRLKQLEKMEKIEIPDDRASVRFRFPPAPHSGRQVVTLDHLSLRYGERTLFDDVNWVLQRGSRFAIVGVNGAGKTSFLKLLSGSLAPSEGEIRLGHEVKVGYYAQLQAESLDLSKTILQELESTAPHLPVSQVRGIAGAFLFSGDAVEKRCAVLSGGEKARVALAKLLLSPSNFLILDEPTNHLDLESKEVLLEALQNYEGTLCLVSHDRSFVAPLVDSVIEIVPSQDGRKGSEVVHLIGSYEDYLEKKIKEASSARSDSRPASQKKSAEKEKDLSPKRSGPSHNQRKSWEREREDLEKAISKLEVEQSEIHTLLGNQQTYSDQGEVLRLLDQQRVIEKNLSEKLTRWEALCHLLE